MLNYLCKNIQYLRFIIGFLLNFYRTLKICNFLHLEYPVYSVYIRQTNGYIFCCSVIAKERTIR